MIAPKRGRRRRGNASIELALSATFMITAMFGVVDYGRMFATANMVSSAARAGTLYGGIDVTKNSDYSGMVNAALTAAQNTSGMTVIATQFCTCAFGGAQQACNVSCGTGTKRTYIKVTANKVFSTAFQYPLIPKTTNLVSTSVLRVQ